ncbi:MAG: hypothetical protein CMP74_00880 [Flavobacteriales bacterium]|nr:hypothetical protein [Flavobacteriales bacterium]
MLFTDSYNQIQLGKLGFYKELGSKFIAYPFLVYNKKDINDKISFVKKKRKVCQSLLLCIYITSGLIYYQSERWGGAKFFSRKTNFKSIEKI